MHFGYEIMVGLGRNNAINSKTLDVNGKLMLGHTFIVQFLKIKACAFWLRDYCWIGEKQCDQ